MKLAAIADLHYSRYGNDHLHPKTHLPERLDSLVRTCLEVTSYCKKNNIDTIIVVGDSFHGKSLISNLAQNLFEDLILKRNSEIKFILVDGNHDLSSEREGSLSCLRIFRDHPNVKLVINGQNYELSEDVVIVPYSPKLIEEIKSIPEKKYKWLFSHFGLNEAKLNSGISLVSDLGLKDLTGRFENVILGHYHKPQEIINDRTKLYYVGSLIQLDWGEKEDIKRFLVIDTESGEISSIPTTKYKKHIVLTIDSEKDKTETLQRAKELIEDGHHVMINKTNKDVNTNDVDSEFLIVDKTEKEISDRGINLDMKDEDKFTKYFQIKGIPESEIKSHLDIVFQIISKCSTQEVKE
jgi:DNA repair exonuclease SbcCD nuclease subunit